MTQSNREVIERAYAAFNARDVDAALALMRDDVSWPKASEGGRVVGKAEIRAYWTRQWAEFDPHVDVLDVVGRDGGEAGVRVRQLVKSLEGNVLSDGELWHVYTIVDGLIARMDVRDPDNPTDGPSTAFRGPA